MCVIGHQESDFNRHSMPLSVIKKSLTNCTKIVTDKRQNQLSVRIKRIDR